MPPQVFPSFHVNKPHAQTRCGAGQGYEAGKGRGGAKGNGVGKVAGDAVGPKFQDDVGACGWGDP